MCISWSPTTIDGSIGSICRASWYPNDQECIVLHVSIQDQLMKYPPTCILTGHNRLRAVPRPPLTMRKHSAPWWATHSPLASHQKQLPEAQKRSEFASGNSGSQSRLWGVLILYQGIEKRKLSIQSSGAGYARRRHQWRRGKHAVHFKAYRRGHHSGNPQKVTWVETDWFRGEGDEGGATGAFAEAAAIQTSRAISRRPARTWHTPVSATPRAAPYT